MRPTLRFVLLLSLLLLFNRASAFGGASKVPVMAQNAMVVSSQRLASQVGVKILQQGGNAVDAAIATGFALAVTLPSAGNLGGGGFMIVHTASGEVTAFDFREKG